MAYARAQSAGSSENFCARKSKILLNLENKRRGKAFKNDGMEYAFQVLPLMDKKELPRLPAASGVYVPGKESDGEVELLYIG